MRTRVEHSRIYSFAHADPQFYVGSADWMTRNLDRRVEAVIPVDDRVALVDGVDDRFIGAPASDERYRPVVIRFSGTVREC